MSMKGFVVGVAVVTGMAFIWPKPEEEKYINDFPVQGTVVEEPEERQSFDEYASNAIRHFVDTGSETPSPWYDTETLEDKAFFNDYAGESPWEPAE